ncbi:MAG: hypothetical protein NC082_00980 [Clostridiales bacterium]|nr:hypothetical protein [Clostridiales bacterium]
MTDTTKMRDHDLVRAIKNTAMNWESDEIPSIDMVIAKVLNNSAPRFYVNYETAYRYVSRAMRNTKCLSDKGRRRGQWADMARQVEIVMKLNRGTSLSEALTTVIEHGVAPRFYITPKSARTVYFKSRR